MSRIRTIKPDFWTDEKLSECSVSARLLFIATWNFADDEGNLDRSAKQIKMRAFPIDNIDCEPLLVELITHGLLNEYSVSGKLYLNIQGFKKHQIINRPSKPAFPLYEPSLNTHGVLSEHSLPKGREGKEGKEGTKFKNIVELPSSTQPNEIENENFEVEVKKPKSKNLEIAEQVFSHWQRVLNHPRAVLGEKTIKLITDRIKDGFSIDALFEAIEGCSKSPHHMGQNETKTVYDSLELIFRNSENTNRFIAMNTKQKPLRVSVDGLSDAANATANAAMDWIDSMQSGEFSSDDEPY